MNPTFQYLDSNLETHFLSVFKGLGSEMAHKRAYPTRRPASLFRRCVVRARYRAFSVGSLYLGSHEMLYSN
jgi:hypothetical protein